jgi:hypothetical protein
MGGIKTLGQKPASDFFTLTHESQRDHGLHPPSMACCDWEI